MAKENNKKKSGKVAKQHRDAGTGQYVKKSYADSHPKTTVSESTARRAKAGQPKGSEPKDGTHSVVRKNKK